jgi:hypothetical protein
LRRGAILLALTAGLAWAAAVAHQDKPKHAPAQEKAPAAGMQGGHMQSMPGMANMRMPRMNPERGREFFVSKGCVACHAINGVGGHDASNLDAHTMQPMMNTFDFAAKMWRMAPYMIAAQEEGLGEQIFFTGEELAHIIAFVHDDEAQHHFSDADLTPQALMMMKHSHGESGGGPKTHAKELGHKHMMGQGHGD